MLCSRDGTSSCGLQPEAARRLRHWLLSPRPPGRWREAADLRTLRTLAQGIFRTATELAGSPKPGASQSYPPKPAKSPVTHSSHWAISS